MKGRIVVVGAAGRLGAAIVEAMSPADVVAHTRATLDVTDPLAVGRAMHEASPDVIVNCAAYNDVDGAETNPTEALAANAFAVRSLARAAESCGSILVHFSTDFVFDGTADVPYDEDARPTPRSTYAASKLLGEWFAMDVPRAYVLRVESLFGAPAAWRGRRGSFDTILDGLDRGAVVKVFTDRVVSPSYVPDIARAVDHLVRVAAPFGLYHCVNSGRATWHDLAAEMARLRGVSPHLQPITLDTAALRAARPRFCALANQKLADAGFAMPSWRDAVQRWLATQARRER